MSQTSDSTGVNKQGIPKQDAEGEIDLMSPSRFGQEDNLCDPTHLASNQGPVQDTISPFMKTPLETRNQIYEYLLSTRHTKVDFLDEEICYTPGWTSRARRVYHFHPAILAVNRQINIEASTILRQNMFVKLTTNASEYGMDVKVNGLPVVAEDDSASRVTYSAIELTLIFHGEAREHCPCVLMFAGDDMITFCRVVLRLGLPGNLQSSLTIAITGVAPTTTSILKLLEPFHRLHSMALVRITGQIESGYKADLITKMSKQAPAIHTVIQEIRNVIDQCDQVASIDDSSTTISKLGRAWEDSEDQSRANPFHPVFHLIRSELEVKLAETYLKLDNHSRAHEWISLTMALITPYPPIPRNRPRAAAYIGGATYASVYSLAAQASEGLGLVGRAVEEMRAAVWHDPGGSKLAAELVRLERKM